MKITGHRNRTTSMFDRYNTVDQEDALRAIEKLDGYLDVERQKITSYLLQGEAYRYKRPLHNPSLHCDPCHCERSEATCHCEAPKELKQSHPPSTTEP